MWVAVTLASQFAVQLPPIRTGLLNGDLSSPCHKRCHWIHCLLMWDVRPTTFWLVAATANWIASRPLNWDEVRWGEVSVSRLMSLSMSVDAVMMTMLMLVTTMMTLVMQHEPTVSTWQVGRLITAVRLHYTQLQQPTTTPRSALRHARRAVNKQKR